VIDLLEEPASKKTRLESVETANKDLLLKLGVTPSFSSNGHARTAHS
jgi:hypothetical protein